MTGFHPRYIVGDDVEERVALEAWGFLTSRHQAKIIVAASFTSSFCSDVRREMLALHAENRVLHKEFVVSIGAIYYKFDPTWRCSFRSIPEDEQRMADAVAGVFGDHVMYAVQCSVPVPEPLLLAMTACITGTKSHDVLIAPIQENT